MHHVMCTIKYTNNSNKNACKCANLMNFKIFKNTLMNKSRLIYKTNKTILINHNHKELVKHGCRILILKFNLPSKQGDS